MTKSGFILGYIAKYRWILFRGSFPQSFPDYAESGKGSAYLGYRLYRTAKYLSGYYSCYGDFDSFEFLPTDAAKLHRLVSGLRAC